MFINLHIIYVVSTYLQYNFQIKFQDTGELLMPSDFQFSQTYGGKEIKFSSVSKYFSYYYNLNKDLA